VFGNIDVLQLASNASRLRTTGMPMLFAMTQSDRLVEWELAVKTARHCGVEETQFTWFDSDEKITRGPSIGLWISLNFQERCAQYQV